MKPEAPDAIRGEFKPIATRTPGIQICEHLPRLAERSEKWALVRSLAHPYPDHSAGHLLMLSGRSELSVGFDGTKPKNSDWPSIAAVANAVCAPRNNLPPSVVLPEILIHREGRVIPGQFAGEMGSHRNPMFVNYSPFNSESYGAWPEYGFSHARGGENPKGFVFQAPNLSLPAGMDAQRFSDRLGLLGTIGRQQRVAGASGRKRSLRPLSSESHFALGRPPNPTGLQRGQCRSQAAGPIRPQYVRLVALDRAAIGRSRREHGAGQPRQ